MRKKIDLLWLLKHLHFLFYSFSTDIHISVAYTQYTDAPGCPDLCFYLSCLTIMKLTDRASDYRQFIMCSLLHAAPAVHNPMQKHLNILHQILFKMFCFLFFVGFFSVIDESPIFSHRLTSQVKLLQHIVSPLSVNV